MRTPRWLGRALIVVPMTLLAGCGSAATPQAATELPPGVAAAPTRTVAAAPRAATRVTPPRHWPRTLQIGLLDHEDGASALRAAAPYGWRWTYLSGGAGTASSWTTWRTGDGSYATAFARDSRRNGMIPFFSYYVLQETPPTSSAPTEQQKVLRGLASRTVMRRVIGNLRLALRRIAEAGAGPAVLQVEPDLWGYAQQRYGNDARRVPVRLHGADRAAHGLPDTLAGLARLVTRIRNDEAPHVLLAYPVSIFGTNKDIVGSQPSSTEVQAMVASSVAFWRTAGRPGDLLTFEYANRDAGYAVHVDKLPRAQAWWTHTDYARHLQYVRGVLRAAKRPGVLWQVPPGNTVTPEMDDTSGHYRDDKAQTLLGRSGRPLLRQMRSAGVAAVLFGSAFPQDTCACAREAGGDPDDGGYLNRQVRRYVHGGALRLRRVPRRVTGAK